jgi:hypothetical protein
MANQHEHSFQVKLDGIELSEAQLKSIEKGIQDLVLRELAHHFPAHQANDIKTNAATGSGLPRIPQIYWRGIWLYNLKPAGGVGVEGIRSE